VGDKQLRLEYLMTSSRCSLEAIELSRLASSSNLRKEICKVVEAWVEAEVGARLTRLVLEGRRVQEPSSETFAPAHGDHFSAKQLAICLAPIQGNQSRYPVLSGHSQNLTSRGLFDGIESAGRVRPSSCERPSSFVRLNASGESRSAVTSDISYGHDRRARRRSTGRPRSACSAIRLLERLGGPNSRRCGELSPNAAQVSNDGSWRTFPICLPSSHFTSARNRPKEPCLKVREYACAESYVECSHA
jgi:hypothetical protein